MASVEPSLITTTSHSGTVRCRSASTAGSGASSFQAGMMTTVRARGPMRSASVASASPAVGSAAAGVGSGAVGSAAAGVGSGAAAVGSVVAGGGSGGDGGDGTATSGRPRVGVLIAAIQP